MSKVSFIVIEDEERICQLYKSTVKKYDNLYLINTTNSATEGLKMAKSYCPYAIVLDLELHKGEGNGLTFLKELSQADLKYKPYILVVTNNISTVTHSMARQYGADLIFTKTQFDYSVDMILDFLDTLNEVTYCVDDNLSYDEQIYRMQYTKNLNDAINAELDLIGIGNKLKGRKYLHYAIELVYERPRPNICAIIAQRIGVTDASVERAMQTAINHAWRNTDIETLERCYNTYVNPKKGVPTVTEFIYYYAEKIKLHL